MTSNHKQALLMIGCLWKTISIALLFLLRFVIEITNTLLMQLSLFIYYTLCLHLCTLSGTNNVLIRSNGAIKLKALTYPIFEQLSCVNNSSYQMLLFVIYTRIFMLNISAEHALTLFIVWYLTNGTARNCLYMDRWLVLIKTHVFIGYRIYWNVVEYDQNRCVWTRF